MKIINLIISKKMDALIGISLAILFVLCLVGSFQDSGRFTIDDDIDKI